MDTNIQILKKPWNPFQFNEKLFYVKADFTEVSITMVLTNFLGVWVRHQPIAEAEAEFQQQTNLTGRKAMLKLMQRYLVHQQRDANRVKYDMSEDGESLILRCTVLSGDVQVTFSLTCTPLESHPDYDSCTSAEFLRDHMILPILAVNKECFGRLEDIRERIIVCDGFRRGPPFDIDQWEEDRNKRLVGRTIRESLVSESSPPEEGLYTQCLEQLHTQEVSVIMKSVSGGQPDRS